MENGITVIIPAHNEERSIAKVVRNVRKNKKVKEIPSLVIARRGYSVVRVSRVRGRAGL